MPLVSDESRVHLDGCCKGYHSSLQGGRPAIIYRGAFKISYSFSIVALNFGALNVPKNKPKSQISVRPKENRENKP
jgi:hypothetical protein